MIDAKSLEIEMTKLSPIEWLPRAIELRREGKSHIEIGCEIGVSGSVVGKTFIRYNVNIPRVPKAEGQAPWAELAKAKRSQGLSWKVIAADLGIGIHMIRCEIDPGFKETKARQTREYMDRDGWAVRRARVQKEMEMTAIVDPAPRQRVPGDILAAGRFLQPQCRRYGR